MTTRDIRPSTAHTVCGVCGRTLLRGERAEAYLHGGTRRWVCELCKTRALHEGWIREGTLPDYDSAGAGSQHRRSLLHRLRSRRERPAIPLEEPDERYPDEPPEAVPARANGGRLLGRPGRHRDAAREEAEELELRRERAEDEPRRARPRRGARTSREGRAARQPRPVREPRSGEPAELTREPRHVRAVPSSPEQRTASAIARFNDSEHPRTVAGVARSLGMPTVAALPSPSHSSLVSIVVSWELCWYRYEVDLSDEGSSVRVAGQGYELDELEPQERVANAVASEQGTLTLAA